MERQASPGSSGQVMNATGNNGLDDPLERSRLLYERAVFEGDVSALEVADRELDQAEADLAVARGRVIHGRFLVQREQDPQQAREDPDELSLFEYAADLYEAGGDLRGRAEALFWVGCCHQLVRRDNDAAVPVLRRSLELATAARDTATMSEALRHLGIADHAAGRLDSARERLEESSRLRREAGLMPGVASNMVGLAYIAAAQGRHDDAPAILDEAAAIAQATGARSIMRHIDEARTELMVK
jgi:tetratricopeptide (TPR) repeat protein